MSPAPLSCGPSSLHGHLCTLDPSGQVPCTSHTSRHALKDPSDPPFQKMVFLIPKDAQCSKRGESEIAQGKEKRPLNLSPGEELITFWAHRFSRLFSPPPYFFLY